jgi:hypothetical protein
MVTITTSYFVLVRTVLPIPSRQIEESISIFDFYFEFLPAKSRSLIFSILTPRTLSYVPFYHDHDVRHFRYLLPMTTIVDNYIGGKVVPPCSGAEPPQL